MAAKGKRVPADKVPEVQAFLEVEQELAQLKADHPDVFMQYADLVERYNAALEAAEQVVKQLGVSCGPFDNYSASDKYDPDKMYEELGEQLFLQLGGTVIQESVCKVDKAKLEAAVALGKIHPESLAVFRSITRSYHAPKKRVV